MIKLGVCTSPDNIALVEKAGFDFIEIGFSWLAGLSEEEYQKALSQVRAAGIGAEAANGMVPGEIKLVGPDADEAKIRQYLDKAFARGSEMGIRVVVFGSGGARSVPQGFPHAEAWRQIARYLKIVSEYCVLYNMELAIEPLRRAECNILNYVTEGTILSALLNLPGIGVLGDTHHMNCGGEPNSALSQAGVYLKHVHISHSMGDEGGRDFPYPGDGADYKALFEELKNAGYEGRVSIEAGCRCLAEDAPKAYELLKAALDA